MASNRGVAYMGPGKVEVQSIDYPELELLAGVGERNRLHHLPGYPVHHPVAPAVGVDIEDSRSRHGTGDAVHIVLAGPAQVA